MKKIEIITPTYNGKTNKIRHASRAILIQEGKILIGYGKKEDFYIIPGGGIEEGESYKDCCKREILEETGIICEPLDNYLDISTFFLDMNHIHHFFTCKIIETNPETHFTAEEIDADMSFSWIEIDKILNIFSEYDKFIETDNAKYLLYKREYIAIKEYLDNL